MTDPPEVVGSAKAAKLLGLSERRVRGLCKTGKLKGAYQVSGYSGKWLIPLATLERIRALPPDLR